MLPWSEVTVGSHMTLAEVRVDQLIGLVSSERLAEAFGVLRLDRYNVTIVTKYFVFHSVKLPEHYTATLAF